MAGRDRVGGAATIVRLGVGICERIDALSGSGHRAEFIRRVVEGELLRLEGGFVCKAIEKVAPQGVDVTRAALADRQRAVWDADDAEVLKGLRGAMTVRELAGSLGWVEMRAEKAVHRLVEADKAYLPGAGLVELVGC